ncbi:arsenosugar biosynthesis radical SAM (seleno)protein ArsS [Lyngbya confervoides]|uniref:Arsenosugar biosynthesis radical SAM protein ArsS n=1 Tax=Lyngbya confervoides BDU141951 TaxID=1574623 RepID=A0ABD4T5N9_9CYAN|nr:arsenosugar biosynthesis radical SAM (seleno)protein ArsS [Lyngbya confervoides]MCM1984003.1 arsenosugar biosynthesis radical SAM protein ArsS [Lyngbya confervoides BDU141951]
MTQPPLLHSAQPLNFQTSVGSPLTKQPISVLQINLGKRCNLACTHCHVEAGPSRTEEMQPSLYQSLIKLIQRFDQIQTVDLTGGAPEMHQGFRPLVEAARAQGKQVIVRSNLTIFYVPGYEDLPEYLAQRQVHIVASLPCYLEENVDKMRGRGVFQDSIRALQTLNRLGYGTQAHLQLDLVYNPPIPTADHFSLTPDQEALEQAYKTHLQDAFGIVFNRLYALTNLPIGRTKIHLQRRQILQPYLSFLAGHYNPQTVASLMCRSELSIDYLGNVYDCDFNQMEAVPARTAAGEPVTVSMLLKAGSLDVIPEVRTRSYCYGCTAGAGSSCGGALVEGAD